MNDKTGMTDKNDKTNERLSPEWEMQLAREVRALDRDIQPSRNLWSGIERRIEAYPQIKKADYSANWLRFGMAASLIMAFSALILTVADLGFDGSRGNTASLFDQSRPSALETIQVEYLKTRGPLVEQFTETNRSLSPDTLEELYRNIEIMVQARKDIEAQVRTDPTNRRLVEQLMRIHEQELALLKQDFSQPSRSM